MTIDWWTLGLQTVNVAVLIWLLAKFFWQPVASIIEERRATAQRMLAEAEADRGRAAAALTDIEQTRAGFARERDAILAGARDSAERARAAQISEAAKAVATLEATATDAIAKQREAADKTWAERSSRLAVEIAERLATRLEGPEVRAAFLEWLLVAIRKLPDAARAAVAANDDPLQAISAAPLEPADQERYRRLIGDALGTHAQIEFKAEPALIAGLELRGSHFIVTNSWRADLAQILAGLRRGNGR